MASILRTEGRKFAFVKESIMTSKKKIRYGVVGLGYIAQLAVLPGFRNATSNSELAALISDDTEKLKKLSRQYKVDHVYSYDEYEDCLLSNEIDAVYIALPNHMHREFTVRAAKAGIHVLCEKPMAVTENECVEMMLAAAENGVKLMIAYRLHFDRSNLKAVEEIQKGAIGDPRIFNSVFTMQVQDDNIRLAPIEEGGGTLYDIGIYCINAARYLFREEPLEALACSATNTDQRFRNCDEMTGVILRFPDDKFANFTCSFGASSVSTYQIVGTKGNLLVESPYEYAEKHVHYLTVDGVTKTQRYPRRDQFGPELVYFSDCILQDKNPEPSGLEGLIDVAIIQGIYQSAFQGRPVWLDLADKTRRPDLKQQITKPPVRKPELIHAEGPSDE
jgi:glucose-fructose oxidoreductase